MGRGCCKFLLSAFIIGIVGIAGIISFAATPAHAYVRTLTSNGIPVHWPSGFKFNLAGNPTNTSGLSDDDFFSSVVHGLERWRMASQGAMQFDYWQGRDPSVYEPNSNYNGLSSIYFASNADGPTGLTPNILGLTQVWYSTHTGEILESDTVLNDRSFVFTENPQDTSGFGSEESERPVTFGSHNHVFVENVITHELGHALGLAHSGTLQSTMLYMESPEQAHLGCDEQTGIHALYPSQDAGSRGTISGDVVGPNGAPIFGATVLAISRRRGAVLSAGMTDPGGEYSIGGLEPGTYFLMAEPYFAGPQPLPAYYSKINSSVCPGRDSFGRTVLVDQSGFLAVPVTALGGRAVGAPEIQVGCHSGEAAITGPSGHAGVVPSLSEGSASVIFDGANASGDTGFGATDRFSTGQPHYYKLTNISGHLEIRVLSYSLYSPIRLSLTLFDSSGQSVSAESLSPIYSGDSGYVNYDSALIADSLPQGDYFLEASPSELGPDLYPAGQISLDSTPFAIITGTLNEGTPALGDELPFNARCRMEENFTSYQSPAGPPPRASIQSQDDQGGCSLLQISSLYGAGSGGGRGGRGGRGSSGEGSAGGFGGGPGSAAAVAWFLPWLMMGIIALRPWRLARR